MLTISKPLSSAQAQTYHREEFSNSTDNYYTQGEKVRGEWHGKLAKQWQLTGEVQELHFGRLADGRHPITGDQLVAHRGAYEYTSGNGETVRSMEHRAGWDATFSAPKSVSLTALVGGDEQVRVAHQESVTAALDQLEKYTQARIGGNHLPETTGKWAAAKFEHDSSRPVNGYAAPQLHTHVVIFNVTEMGNGDTRAVQPHELYRTQQYATAIYRSELAFRLRGLGYEIEQGPSGAPEIKGYTQEYLDASSPRRQQIKEHLAQEGFSGPEAAEIAAHRTRESKLDISHHEMQQRHQQMAAEYGNQPELVVQEAQQRRQQIALPERELSAAVVDRAIDYAIERNFERQAVADERDLMRDTLKRAMGDAPLKAIQEQFKEEVSKGNLLAKEIHHSGECAFTTPEMIALERDNIRFMRDGQQQFPALATLDTRHQIEREYSHLSNAQRGAVQEVLGSHDQITALEGLAGAGKTTSLTAIRDAAQRDAYRVEGFAPTSRAAQKLAESGIDAHTLQHHLTRGPQADDGAKHLYVLDESSLASTRQIHQFLNQLSSQDRVLLVGDVRQHEAVEAGRPYFQLQQAGMRTANLDEIVRQKDPALKEAVEQLSRGEIHQAIKSLERQGRVQEIGDKQARYQAIAKDYARFPQSTLVVSPDNASRRDLNKLIHTEMQERGVVQREEHGLRVLEPRQELTGADRGWAEQYQIGDVLRYSRGSKVVGVRAGEYATVTGKEGKENRLSVRRLDGREAVYDPRRLQGVSVYREVERTFSEGDRTQFTAPSKDLHVANRELGTILRVNETGEIRILTDSGRHVDFHIDQHRHLDHGYAVTSHSSQGQTADRVLVHADTQASAHLVNRRMAYVAVSRGRYDAQIYTDSTAELSARLDRDISRRTALGQDHENPHGAAQKTESSVAGNALGQMESGLSSGGMSAGGGGQSPGGGAGGGGGAG